MSKEMKVSEGVLGIDDLKSNPWRPFAAEFLGTMLLVTIGCGSIISIDNQQANLLIISITFGFLVAVIASCIGHISGCHINPAVTASLFVSGDIKLLKAIGYIIAQLVGASVGSLILRALTPTEFEGNLGATTVSPSLTGVQAFFLEVIYTFMLTFIVQAVCDGRRKDIKMIAPIVIGLSITACHLSGIKYTGASLNPARSFGPAIVMNNWESQWIYWAGPIVGGVFAGIIYKVIFKVRNENSDSYDF